jgi:hypothetical protein
MAMKRTLVRYRTKPEATAENERLIAAVFQELHARSPDGIRYVALKLPDGSFVHFATVEDGAGPLSTFETFRTFQAAVRDRCIEPPVSGEPVIVGNYRMLGE